MLREIIARFSFQLDNQNLKKAETGISGVVGKLQAFGQAIAGAVVVQGIANFVKDIVKAGDELGETAAQLGTSAQELQRWQYGAKFAGVEAEKFNTSLRTIQKNAGEAAGGGAAAAEFKSLGVELKDSNGNLKDGITLMREAGLGMSKLKTHTERVAVAQKIFGRAGSALLPMFAEGEEGLNRFLAKLDEFGGGLGEDAVKLAGEADDAFMGWDISMMSLKSRLAVAFLPILNQVVSGLSRMIGWVSKVIDQMGGLRSLMIAFGIALGKIAIARFGGQLLSLARMAMLPLLKFALLYLIVDDLIALFEGRASVIGTLLDKIFGKGSAQKVVAALKGIGKAVVDLINTGDFEAFDKALENIFGPIGSDIVSDIVFTFEMIAEAFDAWIADIQGDMNYVLGSWDTFWNQLGTDAAIAIGQILAEAYAFGEGIIDGIVQAIEAKAAEVAAALTGVVKDAMKDAKTFLGIQSPSRKAGDEIGKPWVMGIPQGAKRAAARAHTMMTNATAMVTAPTSMSASVRGGGGASVGGGVVFQSDINLTVNGGSASDPQIQKLRQGLRSDLQDNRRATLEALVQMVEVV